MILRTNLTVAPTQNEDLVMVTDQTISSYTGLRLLDCERVYSVVISADRWPVLLITNVIASPIQLSTALQNGGKWNTDNGLLSL